jgi:Uncharacterized KleE stable inheritance protein
MNVNATQNAKKQTVLSIAIKTVWTLTVLLWPILKWVCSLEVLFQLLRMFYHWDTPGMHAGWTFVLHFLAFSALTYFVSVYEPK